jgi:hypothetical protein
LQAYQPGCNLSQPVAALMTMYCISACSRWCVARGGYSGGTMTEWDTAVSPPVATCVCIL